MSKTNIRPMIEVALFATIAYILDLVTQPMSLGPWISLSFKMVPIFLLSFRWGLKAGAMGGLIWGLLQVVTGQAAGGWLTLTQGFLEYFVAFSLIGISGVVKPALDKAIKQGNKVKSLMVITEGILLGSFARYLIHFIAGVIFWGAMPLKDKALISIHLLSIAHPSLEKHWPASSFSSPYNDS